jgi:hypothetical protein
MEPEDLVDDGLLSGYYDVGEAKFSSSRVKSAGMLMKRDAHLRW